MRWFVKLFLGIFSLFALVIALVILLLDADDLKPSLYALVHQHTGLILEIKGPLELSLFPRPELAARGVRISVPGSARDQSLLEADHWATSVSAWSMWSGRLRLLQLDMDGLVLDASWASRAFQTGSPQSHSLAESPLATALPTGKKGLWPRAITQIQQLHVTNATLTHVPGLTSSVLSISQLDIQGLGQEVPAPMQCQVTCDDLALDMNGSLTLSRDWTTLLAEDLQARLTMPSPFQTTTSISTHLTGTLFLDPQNHRLVMRALRATLPGLDILTSSTFTWAQPSWEGGLIVNARIPQCVPALGLATVNLKTVPRQVDLRTHVSLHPDTLVLRDLLTVMDGQSFHGQAKVSDFSRPNITFKVFGDHVDLSRYVFPSKNTPATPPQWLKTARIRGSFSANRIALGSMIAENPQTLVRARKGILRIYPFRATINNGSLEANVRVNLNTSPPTSTFRAHGKNIQIRNLIDTGKPSTGLIGSLNMFLDLTWEDVPWRLPCATMRGQATLDAVNGTLVGVRLPRRHPPSLLTQRASSPEDIIPFSRLDARFEVDNGIVKSRRFQLKNPLFTLAGQGTYDLCSDQLDGTLSLSGTQPGQTLDLKGSLNRPRLHVVPSLHPRQ